jgi:hypothetical protein
MGVADLGRMRLLGWLCLASLVPSLACCEGVRLARALAFTHEPPRPPNCDIAFERVSPRDVPAEWREIGVVCLAAEWCDGAPGGEPSDPARAGWWSGGGGGKPRECR